MVEEGGGGPFGRQQAYIKSATELGRNYRPLTHLSFSPSLWSGWCLLVCWRHCVKIGIVIANSGTYRVTTECTQ